MKKKFFFQLLYNIGGKIMDFKCELCGETIVLQNDNINHRRGKKAQHFKKCVQYQERKQQLTKEFLTTQYCVNNRNALDIASDFGFTNTTTVDKLLKKYGIKKRGCQEVGFTQSVIDKRKNTVMEKYGVDNVAKNELIKRRIKSNTNWQKFSEAVSNGLSSKTHDEWVEIAKKRAATMLGKYGVDNVTRWQHVKNKMSMTRLGFKEGQELEWIEFRKSIKIPQDLYPDVFFSSTLRKLIWEDQNYCCGLCKNKRNKKIKHPLHHIDSNKENCNRENLIFLCASCHGKSHGGIQVVTKYKKILNAENKIIIEQSLGGVPCVGL
jgi:hypothetical protein